MEKFKSNLKLGIKHIVSNPIYVVFLILVIVLWGVISAEDIPPAPSELALSINQNSTSLTLVWEDNSLNEENFVIQRQLSGGDWSVTNYVSFVTTTNTYEDISAAMTISYDYRVQACLAAVGCSDWSNVLTEVFRGVPVSPSGLALDTINSTTSSIVIIWTDNSTNENKFNVFRKLHEASDIEANWSNVAQIPIANTTTYQDTSVTLGALYDYRVEACLSAYGCSPLSNILSGVSVMNATIPLAPTDLLIQGDITSNSVTLTWTDNSSNEDKFNIERRITGASSWSFLNLVTVPNTTSYVDDSVVSGTSYDYQIQACRTNFGCSTSAVLNNVVIPSVVVQTIPLPPSNLSRGAVTPSFVIINWKDNANNEDKFNVDRKLSTSSSAWVNLIQIVEENVAFYKDNSVTAGQTYDYRVQTCLSGVGCSAYVILSGISIPNSNTGSGGGTVSLPSTSTISNNNPPIIPPTVNTINTINNNPPIIPPTTNTVNNIPPIIPPTTNTINNNPPVSNPKPPVINSENNTVSPLYIPELNQDNINNIVNVISNIETSNSEIVNLIYQDTNNDGISDYDSIYVYNLDPIKSSPTSTYEGRKITAGEKILLGFDPTNSELIKIKTDEPIKSKAPTIPSYKVNKIDLTEKKEIIINGQALPNSFVTLYIYSTPIMVTIKTDDKGEWQYVLDKELESGDHTIYTATVNNTGNIIAKSSGYVFTKTAEAVTLKDLPITGVSTEIEKPGLEGKNIYVFISVTFILIFAIIILTGILSKKNNEDQNLT